MNGDNFDYLSSFCSMQVLSHGKGKQSGCGVWVCVCVSVQWVLGLELKLNNELLFVTGADREIQGEG